jgi:hypothetical protein
MLMLAGMFVGCSSGEDFDRAAAKRDVEEALVADRAQKMSLPVAELVELCERASLGSGEWDSVTSGVCWDRRVEIEGYYSARFSRELEACLPALGRGRCEELLLADECVRDLAACAADAGVCMIIDEGRDADQVHDSDRW